MTVWIFTTEAPYYLPSLLQNPLEEHAEIIDRVVFAEQPLGRFMRQQYRLFGPIDGLRMGGLYARGRVLSMLPPDWQQTVTGKLHSVRDTAALYDVPTEVVPDVSDHAFVERVRSENPELILSVFCGQRFPRKLLDVPDWAINLHPSLLPDYRGPAPEFWALFHGEEFTGYTAHVMTEAFDAGAILDQRELPIRDDDTLHSLTQRLAKLGGEQASDILDRFPDAEFELRANPVTEEDYYPIPTAKQRREFKRRGNRIV